MDVATEAAKDREALWVKNQIKTATILGENQIKTST